MADNKTAVATPVPEKKKYEVRSVRRAFNAGTGLLSVGDEVNVTDWPNRQALINSGYLSQEYRYVHGDGSPIVEAVAIPSDKPVIMDVLDKIAADSAATVENKESDNG